MKRPLLWSLALVVLTASLLTGGLLARSASLRKQSLPVAAAGALRDIRTGLTAFGRRARTDVAGRMPNADRRPDAGDRIAFIDRRGHVVTAAPDGGTKRQLTPRGSRHAFPTWAPDGRTLAALGASTADAGIYLMSDGDAMPVEAWTAEDGREPFYLFWSPDGSRLGYLSGDEAGVELRVRGRGDLAGPALAQGKAVYWDWLGDGRSLLIHGVDGSDSGRLDWLDLPPANATAAAGGPVRQIMNHRPAGFQSPSISAGDRYMAFGAHAREAGNFVTIVNREHRANPLRIAYRGRAAMVWSPKAETLAFISPPLEAPTFAGSLRVVEMPGGTVRHLANAAVLGFFWSPDGRRIACFTLGLPQQGATIQAALGPDSRDFSLELWMIEVDSGRSRRLMRFRPTRSFSEQVLPFFDQYAHSHRIWSPDSSRLVLAIDDPREGPGIHVVTVAGPAAGRSQRIADGSIAFWSPR